ncbi:MAG TPA: class I SAM-dependent methyltransferase [Candidatus Omnitrophota bacterium]|nr:class I SAM-dependent methyltransferase [Candidatus Omnitrophota bacterium]
MNLWDKLAGIFGREEEMPQGIADHVLLAYPVMIELIQKSFPIMKHVRVLDFGCGNGRLCKKLHAVGCRVTGLDTSEEMIRTAGKGLPSGVNLVAGPIEKIEKEKFDVIISSLVFQFIREIDVTIRQLDRLLKPTGLFVLSAFNPPFVSNLLKEKMTFRDFDSREFPRVGTMALAESDSVPVFIREPEEYSNFFVERGYKKLLEAYPPFTEEYLEKHPVPFPVQDPEFLILGFQKN